MFPGLIICTKQAQGAGYFWVLGSRAFSQIKPAKNQSATQSPALAVFEYDGDADT